MAKRLSNKDREAIGNDYKPEDKRKADRRTAISTFCEPKMDRRVYSRRSETGGNNGV